MTPVKDKIVDFSLPWLDDLRERGPGLLFCLVVSLAAYQVAGHFGYPVLPVALVFGILLRPAASTIAPGVNFAARRVLEFGVALLGFRMTLETIIALGLPAVVIVALAVIATMALAAFAAPALGCDRRTGLLAGGATAICGSSACLAIASTLPKDRRTDQAVAVVIVGVTVCSTTAMLLYPLLVRGLGLPDPLAGIVLGGSIHNVPQAVGAGYAVSDAAGAAATLTKLLRVSLLLPVVATLAVVAPRVLKVAPPPTAGKGRPLPWFILAFVAALAVNSFGLIPESAVARLSELSSACLVVAISAVGLKTSLDGLMREGWRPLALILLASLFLVLLLTAAAGIGAI